MPLFSKKQPKKATRLFFATDLHGSERTYRKFIQRGKIYDVDILVMGGDITGKLLIPIIKENNDHYRAIITGQGRRDKLHKLNWIISSHGWAPLGFYHKIMDEAEFRALSADENAVDELFHHVARQRLSNWVDLAEERLARNGEKMLRNRW